MLSCDLEIFLPIFNFFLFSQDFFPIFSHEKMVWASFSQGAYWLFGTSFPMWQPNWNHQDKRAFLENTKNGFSHFSLTNIKNINLQIGMYKFFTFVSSDFAADKTVVWKHCFKPPYFKPENMLRNIILELFFT